MVRLCFESLEYADPETLDPMKDSESCGKAPSKNSEPRICQSGPRTPGYKRVNLEVYKIIILQGT